MKARTKAERLRSKRGRPRIEGVDRTPDGRISRSSENTERYATATVIDMRRRLYGATGANAKRAEWGYVLGRIYLDGNLGPVADRDEEDFEKRKKGDAELRLLAGNSYAEDMSRYFGLVGIPFPSARAQSLFAVRGHPAEYSASLDDAVSRATNKAMRLEGALLSCRDGKRVMSTIKNVVLLDLDEARGWPGHMMDYLRRGLDALVAEYGLTYGGKSATRGRNVNEATCL